MGFSNLFHLGAQALELVMADAEALAGSVKNTCDLSERVSVKVRELDSAQVRNTLHPDSGTDVCHTDVLADAACS